MHTLLHLQDGVLRAELHRTDGSEPEELNKARWRKAIAPAAEALRALGGGKFCITHHPEDLELLA